MAYEIIWNNLLTIFSVGNIRIIFIIRQNITCYYSAK